MKKIKQSLKFALAFDVIDEAGNSVLEGDRMNAVLVNMEGMFPKSELTWGIPNLLGLYAKHFASMPEFKAYFPWYVSRIKDAKEPSNNNAHKSPDTPFVYDFGSMLFVRPNKQPHFSVEDSIPTGFPL